MHGCWRPVLAPENNYGGVAQTHNSCTFALLESVWLVLKRIKERLTAQFGKLCFHWKEQLTNTYQKSAEQGRKRSWTGLPRSHNLEVNQ